MLTHASIISKAAAVNSGAAWEVKEMKWNLQCSQTESKDSDTFFIVLALTNEVAEGVASHVICGSGGLAQSSYLIFCSIIGILRSTTHRLQQALYLSC